jgi:hypothetical protein
VDFLKNIVEYCNNYIKENPFLSVIVFGVLTNFLTDLVKIAFARSVTGSIIISRYLSKRLVINGIKGYKLQLVDIEEYKDDPLKKTAEYVVHLYDSFFMFILIAITLYIFINFFYDRNTLFAFYGASSNVMFRLVFGTALRASTFRSLVFNLSKYEDSTRKTIQRLELLTGTKSLD